MERKYAKYYKSIYRIVKEHDNKYVDVLYMGKENLFECVLPEIKEWNKYTHISISIFSKIMVFK